MICPVCRGDMLREGDNLVCVVCGEELILKHNDAQPKWIPVKERLPNEDEIDYSSICIVGERKASDRVLAVYSDGLIVVGHFMKSGMKHEYHGKAKANGYGVATWEFGDYKMGWLVSNSGREFPTHWMPLPEPPEGEEE